MVQGSMPQINDGKVVTYQVEAKLQRAEGGDGDDQEEIGRHIPAKVV